MIDPLSCWPIPESSKKGPGGFVLEIIGIVAFLLLMMASIALHEIGHLVPAKKFNVRVPEYMVGFGPTVVSWRRGETRYGIKLFPLGGYIRMIGMLPPPPDAPEGTARSLTTGRGGALIHSARQQSLEEITPEDTNRVFYKLSPWKRIIIMMGGPTMNLLLAGVLFSIVIAGIGIPAPTLQVDRVLPCIPTAQLPLGQASEGETGCLAGESAAALSGVVSGDIITSFDGQTPSDWNQFNQWVQQSGGQTVEIAVIRDGRAVTYLVDIPTVQRPRIDSRGNPTGEVLEAGYFGVQPAFAPERQSILSVPGAMLNMTGRALQGIVTLPIRLYELVTVTLLSGGDRAADSPVSVVGASRIGGEVVASDEPIESKVAMFLGLAASINLFLFLFNLLPILPLDGGHVAGALYEALKRRVNRLLGRPDPGPVDTARMLPVAYAMAAVLIAVGGVVILADILRPLSLL